MVLTLFSFSFTVSAVAQQVLWNCLIEDPSTVLRHFLEKLTISNRQVNSSSPQWVHVLLRAGEHSCKQNHSVGITGEEHLLL